MILVTGATGHVGNTLVHDLAQKGESLRLLLLPNESVGSLDGLSFELFCGDITQIDDVMRAVEGCSEVYHLAGLIDLSPKQTQQLEAINVKGTQNIVQACLTHGVKRLVYISSVHALPEPPNGFSLKELSAAAFPNLTLKGAYAITKSKATAAVYAGIARGLDAVIIFPSGIIGPGDYRGSQMGKVIRRILNKKHIRHLPIFKGAYNFVDVRDVSIALQKAMTQGKSGEGYIISGHTITIKALFTIIAHWRGIHAVKFTNWPLSIVKWAAKLVEKCAYFFHFKPSFTTYSIDVLNSNPSMDNQKARQELDFRPRSLEETLDQTLSWWQKQTERILPKKHTKKRRKP